MALTSSEITVRLPDGAVLALGARGGTALQLRAEGEDAELALAALAACVSGLVE